MIDVEGVVLAAGLSSRSASFKMTLPLGGKTVIERSLMGMRGVASRIYVVVGWKASTVRELLDPYPEVELVANERYRAGMFSSVKVGVARVRASRFFLLPGDCPLVGAGVYRQMLAVDGDIAIPTYRGRKGHPVLFRGELVPEILRLPASATLRDYIASRGYTPVEVEDEGVLLDVDTPEDYDLIVARCGRTH